MTLSWNKHYENCFPFNALPEKDNDLSIELWAIDNLNPENSYLLDYSDSAIDNIEHIHIPADPNYTDYEIVLSIDKDQNSDNSIQRYGLAWNVSQKQDKNNSLWFDLDADGSIDNADLTKLFLNRINSVTSSDEYIIGDIDLDGKIDTSDLAILFDNLDSENPDDFQESDILVKN